ncbi:hypothetical protein [Microlunatus aurantiacus]|uniref:hypothetical protein n=1 Tax=Microlunatus aurantiacus TaxID=446786 RepID=UPI0031E30D34
MTSWKEIPAPDGAIADIKWAGSAWIAVGWSDGNGRVWVSTNLQSWRQLPVVLPGDLESSDFESIDRIAGEWRILGEAQEPGANTYPAMWRTQDLVNFSVPEYPIGRADYKALGESEATRDYLTDVASHDGKTVLIHRRLSDGRLRDRQFYAFSKDGFNFKRAGNLMQEQQSEEIFAVAALKGRGWLAVGTRKDYPSSTPVSALFSTSGTRWDPAGTIVGSPEVRTIYDLAVSPKEIVMIGEPSGQDDYRTWLWTLNVDPCKHT